MVKKKVKVQVTRVSNQAFPWTTFQSLAVSLRDTAAVTGPLASDRNIYTLTVSKFNEEGGGIVFSPLTASLGARRGNRYF